MRVLFFRDLLWYQIVVDLEILVIGYMGTKLEVVDVKT